MNKDNLGKIFVSMILVFLLVVVLSSVVLRSCSSQDTSKESESVEKEEKEEKKVKQKQEPIYDFALEGEPKIAIEQGQEFNDPGVLISKDGKKAPESEYQKISICIDIILAKSGGAILCEKYQDWHKAKKVEELDTSEERLYKVRYRYNEKEVTREIDILGKKNGTTGLEHQPEQPKPEQPKPEQPKLEQPKPEQPKPEQPKPEQPKPEQPKPEQPKPEQPKPEQPKPEQLVVKILPQTSVFGEELKTLQAEVNGVIMSADELLSKYGITLTKAPGNDAKEYHITGVYAGSKYDVSFEEATYTIQPAVFSIEDCIQLVYTNGNGEYSYNASEQMGVNIIICPNAPVKIIEKVNFSGTEVKNYVASIKLESTNPNFILSTTELTKEWEIKPSSTIGDGGNGGSTGSGSTGGSIGDGGNGGSTGSGSTGGDIGDGGNGGSTGSGGTGGDIGDGGNGGSIGSGGTRTDAVTNVEADAVTDVEADAVTDVEADAVTDVEADAVTDVEADAVTDVEADAVTDVEADAVTDVEADAVTDVEADAVTDVEADAVTDVRAEGESFLKSSKLDAFVIKASAIINKSFFSRVGYDPGIFTSKKKYTI